MLCLAITLVLGPLLVASHGNMVWPPTWFDPDGKDGLRPGGVGLSENLPMMWFSNWTLIPEDQEATLDPLFFTVPDFHGDAWSIWDRVNCLAIEGLHYDVCKAWYPINPARNPWMAPGTAPVFSPCGWGGGNPEGCGGVPYGQECPGGGYSVGFDSRSVVWNDTVTTEWMRGSAAEVGWGLLANHGGGYSYRLCKVGPEGPSAVTEECFQQTPLKFASENSWVQYGWDVGSRVEFRANRTREGTFPLGSEWTMNPIPVCNSTAMGWLDPSCPQGWEFPPRAPGLHGTGEDVSRPGQPSFDWTLMDEVEVPADLEAGDYVLSFRWDCEGTPQIWNSCSNIKIV